MTTALDNVFVPMAKKLIAQFGTSATLRRESRTYVVATGKNTTTNTDTSVTISPPQRYNRRRHPDTLIEDGDMMTYLAASGLSITPSPKTDKVIYASTEWQIVQIWPLISGDQTAAYLLQLRQ